MDICTFGKIKSAQNLMTILSKPEHTQFSHKASRILAKYFHSTKAITDITDKETRETCLILWRDRFLGWIDRSMFPTIIETHMKCVIVSQYRKLLKGEVND